MIQKALLRSALHLTGLCLVAMFLLAPVQALEECPITWSCTELASNCAQQCGETVTWDYIYTAEHWWQDQWEVWHYDPHDVYNYSYGSGIENFECDELAETSTCVCTYR